MIYISLLELSVTGGTGVDVSTPESPATNALHKPPHRTQATADARQERASRLFGITFVTCQFHKDL